jgi:2-C-methyl-D-erythritol 4-phosphate cytidylyltransferase
VPVAGRPMLGWSLDAFARSRAVVAGVVAAPPGQLDAVAELAGRSARGEGGKTFRVVSGGESRSESVAAGLAAVETEVTVVHDAARPLVTPELIDAIVEELVSEGCEGVIAATRATDTVKQAAGREVERTLDRSTLWAAQTPQAFRTAALRRALDLSGELAEATDDAMLVERQGGRVLLHEAPPENVKVTTELDLQVAELLLRQRSG